MPYQFSHTCIKKDLSNRILPALCTSSEPCSEPCHGSSTIEGGSLALFPRFHTFHKIANIEIRTVAWSRFSPSGASNCPQEGKPGIETWHQRCVFATTSVACSLSRAQPPEPYTTEVPATTGQTWGMTGEAQLVTGDWTMFALPSVREIDAYLVESNMAE